MVLLLGWLRTLKYAELIGDERVKSMKAKHKSQAEILYQLVMVFDDYIKMFLVEYMNVIVNVLVINKHVPIVLFKMEYLLNFKYIYFS